jgi:hypothetical protein
VWHAITDFLLKAKASGLGHDAVIEIMIALLGVMMAALSLLGVLISFVLAVLGVFGYQTIKGEAKRMAKGIAEKVATEIASKVMTEVSERGQASGLSESQVEDINSKTTTTAPKQSRPRKKATSDKGLQKS